MNENVEFLRIIIITTMAIYKTTYTLSAFLKTITTHISIYLQVNTKPGSQYPETLIGFQGLSALSYPLFT